MGYQARMVDGGGFGVVKHVDGRSDGDESAGAISCTLGGVSKFDADPVLADGHGCDG